MKITNKKISKLAWPALAFFLSFVLNPLLSWSLPLESMDSSRIREKPIPVPSQGASALFSPMDGNDWVENGDGTFTLKRSYLDEAAFKRTPVGMPYNDLDLYTFGLLDPNKVNSPFVIENPTLEDGRALRMHSSGNLVEIQNPDGTWTGPLCARLPKEPPLALIKS